MKKGLKTRRAKLFSVPYVYHHEQLLSLLSRQLYSHVRKYGYLHGCGGEGIRGQSSGTVSADCIMVSTDTKHPSP